jgi:hypothetical protein
VGLEQDLEQFLLQNRQTNSRDFVLQQNNTARVVILAELHVGLAVKARFLASVIQGAAGASQPRFHASEHFLAEPKHRVEIQNYVYSSSKPSGNRLPSGIRPFQPVLEAARTFSGHAYAILAGGSSATAGRDQAILNAFTGSIQRHNTLFPGQQVTTSTKGNFLIGAAHGARKNFKTASSQTTTELLIQNGFTVSVIRFVVDILGSSSVTPGAVTVVGGESVDVEPVSGSGGAIDLLPVLRKVANGSMFHVVITGSASPFAKVKEESGQPIAYNQLYDSILYLPG